MLHNPEHPNLAQELINSQLQSWAMLAAGGTLLASSLAMPFNQTQRILGLSSSLLMVAASGSSVGKELRLKQQLSDTLDIANAEASYRWFTGLRNPTLSQQVTSQLADSQPKLAYQTYNPADLRDAPHIALVAPTGCGKSVFLNYLLSTHFDDQSLILLDPHSRPNECFEVNSEQDGLDLISQLESGQLKAIKVGGGRRYSDIGYMLEALYQTMDKRFSSGKPESYPTINFVIEELPSVALTEPSQSSWKLTNRPLLLEARKAQLRMFIVSQSVLVNLIGLKNMSEMREAYTFIYLGAAAIKKANQLKNEQLASKLIADRELSLKEFAKSEAKKAGVKFQGTCVLIDDLYLKYQNLSWAEPPMFNLPANFELPEPTPEAKVVPEPTNQLGNQQPEANQQLANQVEELTNLVTNLQTQLSQLSDLGPPPSPLKRLEASLLAASKASQNDFQQGQTASKQLIDNSLITQLALDELSNSLFEASKATFQEASQNLPEAESTSNKQLISAPAPEMPTYASELGQLEAAEALLLTEPSEKLSESTTPQPQLTGQPPESTDKSAQANLSLPKVELDADTYRVLADYSARSKFTKSNYQAYLDSRQAGLSMTKALNKLGIKSGARYQVASRLVKTLAEYQLDSADQLPAGLLLGS